MKNLLFTTTTAVISSDKTHQWIFNAGWEIPGEKYNHILSSYHPKGRTHLNTLTMEKTGEHHVDQLIKSTVTDNGAK